MVAALRRAHRAGGGPPSVRAEQCGWTASAPNSAAQARFSVSSCSSPCKHAGRDAARTVGGPAVRPLYPPFLLLLALRAVWQQLARIIHRDLSRFGLSCIRDLRGTGRPRASARASSALTASCSAVGQADGASACRRFCSRLSCICSCIYGAHRWGGAGPGRG